MVYVNNKTSTFYVRFTHKKNIRQTRHLSMTWVSMCSRYLLSWSWGFSSSIRDFLAWNWSSCWSCCLCWHLMAMFPQLNRFLDDRIDLMVSEGSESCEAVVLTPVWSTILSQFKSLSNLYSFNSILLVSRNHIFAFRGNKWLKILKKGYFLAVLINQSDKNCIITNCEPVTSSEARVR